MNEMFCLLTTFHFLISRLAVPKAKIKEVGGKMFGKIQGHFGAKSYGSSHQIGCEPT